MSDENSDPDLITGMGGADDGSGSAPLPIPADVPIERLIANNPFIEGGTGSVSGENQPQPPDEPEQRD